MLAVVKEQKTKGVRLKQVPVPKPQKDELLIKVKIVSICGTDVNIYDWTPWAQSHINPPIIVGHEVVGEVVEINGKSKNIKVGDLISSETHIFCGRCYQCKIGNKHICENMQLFGIGRNGGFAQYATVPIKTSWKNDKTIPLEEMSSQEPLGNAVHVIHRVNVKGKTVLVTGLGPTGLCAVAAAKAYGAKKIIALNRGSYRRVLGKKMGADEVYEKLPEKYLNKMDVVLEMSGNEIAIQTAFEAARIKATVIIFGIPKKDISLNFGKYFIDKELTVKGVFGRKIWETWEDVSELLKSKKVDLTKIITHRFKLSEFEKAMEVMKSGECGKILLIP
ncbi:MAG: alcohol dehydrogenase catalytic domain-containing protein [Candidatus Levybacteria bacterium]|nr:alcohol dehydrogenase catalytic domain-containing protein [Candidatus Levybacteria bacterium]